MVEGPIAQHAVPDQALDRSPDRRPTADGQRLVEIDGKGCEPIVVGVGPSGHPGVEALSQIRDPVQVPIILLDESYEEAHQDRSLRWPSGSSWGA